jgi:hypothetical protein
MPPPTPRRERRLDHDRNERVRQLDRFGRLRARPLCGRRGRSIHRVPEQLAVSAILIADRAPVRRTLYFASVPRHGSARLSGLAAHGRQNRIRPLALDDGGEIPASAAPHSTIRQLGSVMIVAGLLLRGSLGPSARNALHAWEPE